MDDPVLQALHLARDQFGLRVAMVRDEQWSGRTPCDEWTVRDLVNHVVGQEFRFADNLATNDPEWYLTTRDDDFIADDPIGAWSRGRILLDDAIAGLDSLDTEVRWRMPLPARSVLAVRIFEAAVHGWDLSRAIGVDETIPPQLVALALPLAQHISADPALAGMLGTPKTTLAAEASAQEQLLHLAGR